MKKLSLFALALCAPLATITAAQEKRPDRPEKRQVESPDKKVYRLGSVVDPKLRLTDLDGESLSFGDLRGKVVFIHFWSKDCPYEKLADPKVAALEERWKDKDVAVLAIDSNVTEIGPRPSTENYDAIRAHLKKKGLTNRVFADHGNVVADMFEARSTPHCFVLDREGKVVYAGGLDDDPRGEKGDDRTPYVRNAVEAVLAGDAVPVKESKPYGCSIKRVKLED